MTQCDIDEALNEAPECVTIKTSLKIHGLNTRVIISEIYWPPWNSIPEFLDALLKFLTIAAKAGVIVYILGDLTLICSDYPNFTPPLELSN